MITMLQINHISIWTETFGANKNNAIVLIAGAMAPATFWVNEFCERLASKYFVIRFDNRDFGYSTHFEETEEPPYQIEDMVEDTKQILDYYGIEKALIVGHSLGGSIAQLFAVTYPERTAGLIPISSPVIAKGDLCFIETAQDILNNMWSVLMSNKMYQDYERGKDEFLRVHTFLNGDFPIDKEMSYAYTKRLYETEIIKPHQNHTNIQKYVPDIFDSLYALDRPILFIYGNRDYLAANPENAKVIAQALSNSRLVMLDGVGHMFFSHNIWDKIYDEISSFLKCEK